MSQILVTGEAKVRDIQGPVVANSGVITALDGDASQYVRGDGTLADFPTSSGGGSSVSYYLNSSVSQGTIGGLPYKQLSKIPISGAGTDITISANGYVASYLTDANDPSLLEVPAGNFNCEFYFSVNSNNHNPYVYAELYKYDGTTFTLLGSNQAIPEYLTNGTTLSAYYFAIPVAVAALTVTDRLAIRIYVNVDSRVVTLHTENNHLCQVVTTFSKGLISLNNLTRQNQFFGTGTSGTDFNIASSVATHTFNLPVASAANTGKLSSTDWSTFNGKVPYTGATANLDLGLFSISGSTLFLNGTPTTIPGYLYLKKIGNAAYINYADYGGITAYSNNFTFISDVNGTDMKRAIFDLASLTNNTARTYTLPDASGTLALTSNLSAYVPYTGATSDVNLGNNILNAGSININPSSGEAQLNLKNTSTGNTIYNGFSSIFGVGGGALGFGLSTGSSTYKSFTFNFAPLTNNTTRIFTFPDASGTLALTSDLSAYVTLATAQTISGAKTFSLDISVNGLTVGKGSGSAAGNTAFGVSALGTNTTGIGNTGIGNNALTANTTGVYNTAIGWGSLRTNTTGDYNIAIVGLDLNTTGNANIAIGGLVQNTTGSNNIAIGGLINNTTGSNNISIGGGALQFSTTGEYNIGIGKFAGNSITNATYNTFLGNSAGSSITTGSNNTIVGNYNGTTTLANNIVLADGAGNIRYQWNGTNNVFGNPISGTSATFSSNITVNSVQIGSAGNTTNIKLGDSAFGAITTGSNNIAIGSSALTSLTTSNANIGIGNSALSSVVDGAFNTGIGFAVGSSITSGSNNALFGYGAGSAITTGNYNTILGAYAGTAAMVNNIVLADGQGNVRYQWDGTNNVFGNPLSGTSASFTGIVSSIVSSGGTSFRVVNADNSRTWSLIPSTNAAESDLWLYYGGTGAGTKVSFVNNGNVLIGSTTDNGSRLQVTGAATFSSSVTAASFYVPSTTFGTSPTPSYQTIIKYGQNNTFAEIQGGNLNESDFSTYLRFIVNGTASNTPLVAMTINNLGDVAIGTTTPLLTASGRGNLTINGSSNSLLSFGIGGASSGYIFSSSTALEVDAQNSRHIQFNTNSAERARITSGGELLIKGTFNPYASAGRGNITLNGSNNIIAFANNSSARAYIYHDNTDMEILNNIGKLTIYTAGAPRMTIASGGNVLINTTSTVASKFVVVSEGTTSSTYAGIFADSAGADLLTIRSDKAIFAPGIYNFTSGSVANVIVFSDGSLQRSTVSSARFKENINNWNTSGLNTILALKPKEFTYKADYYNYPDRKFLGLIAEDVQEVSNYLVDFENEDGSGQVENVRYANIVVPLIKAVQELKAEIEELKAKIK